MEIAKEEANPTLVIRRTIRAKRDKVFAAWTDPKRMQEWFYPGDWSSKASNELRIGGKYCNEMIKSGDTSSCGQGTEGQNSVVHSGEYLEISPPEKLVFTWNSPIVTNTRVTVELKDLGESTELTLTHELLHTEELRSQHNGGWEACLANLVSYVEK